MHSWSTPLDCHHPPAEAEEAARSTEPTDEERRSRRGESGCAASSTWRRGLAGLSCCRDLAVRGRDASAPGTVARWSISGPPGECVDSTGRRANVQAGPSRRRVSRVLLLQPTHRVALDERQSSPLPLLLWVRVEARRAAAGGPPKARCAASVWLVWCGRAGPSLSARGRAKSLARQPPTRRRREGHSSSQQRQDRRLTLPLADALHSPSALPPVPGPRSLRLARPRAVEFALLRLASPPSPLVLVSERASPRPSLPPPRCPLSRLHSRMRRSVASATPASPCSQGRSASDQPPEKRGQDATSALLAARSRLGWDEAAGAAAAAAAGVHSSAHLARFGLAADAMRSLSACASLSSLVSSTTVASAVARTAATAPRAPCRCRTSA